MDKRRILSARPKIKKGRRDGGDGSKKPGISSSVNSNSIESIEKYGGTISPCSKFQIVAKCCV